MQTEAALEKQKSAVDVAQSAWLRDFLSFEPTPVTGDVREQFTLLVADRLGARIGALTQTDNQTGKRLAQRMGELPAASFLRILIAPEAVDRLLWPERHQADDIGQFFVRAVEAERALCKLDFEVEQTGWTALGDKWCADGTRRSQLVIEDFPPIVLGDPHFRHPLAFDVPNTSAARYELPRNSIAQLKEQLSEVRERIKATDEWLWAFVKDSNVTLVLRRANEGQRGFRSSSPERYVGRSILWDPDSSSVTIADLAEALVHEGIHTVLDSTDALISRVNRPGVRWVTEAGQYDGVSRVVSPWTGSHLDVPTFVHGFFVWFGLLCFWSRVLLRNSFDKNTTQQRIVRAGAPFMNRTALKALERYEGVVRADVLELMQSIQDDVSNQFQGVQEGH